MQKLETLQIASTKAQHFTPSVLFNVDSGKCEISGESYLEDTHFFYQPLLNWMNRYISEKKGDIEFSIKLSYYNTSSSKYILELLRILKQYREDGGKVEIFWYYPESDSNIKEEAEDYKEFLGMDIIILPM
ncbi:MAG: DUF1987 domain-containing protein [Flammeovirgaceae bacterium]|nr:DUF1987 domain-containing protein [Flammeovirgaceae bacterium]